ncbi:hypothetical protein PFWH6_3782 [Pseudomonas fluorescens WH6]|nr:hypothetical protein PFWH6_3782 [Pseudomonas fluorescens WH6]
MKKQTIRLIRQNLKRALRCSLCQRQKFEISAGLLHRFFGSVYFL